MNEKTDNLGQPITLGGGFQSPPEPITPPPVDEPTVEVEDADDYDDEEPGDLDDAVDEDDEPVFE